MTQPFIICVWCEGKGLLHEFLPGMTVLGTTIKRVSEVMVPRLLVPWTDETLYRELKGIYKQAVTLCNPDQNRALLDEALRFQVERVAVVEADDFSVDPSDLRLSLHTVDGLYAVSVDALAKAATYVENHQEDPAKFFRSEKNVLRPTRWLEAQGRTSPEVY